MSSPKTNREWIARFLVAIVFASNMYCAVTFLVYPGAYVGSYQLEGEGALAAISGLGVAFAMWNATYPAVIVFPYKFRALFGVVIAQQIIGLAGETWILNGLGATQAILASSITRFIVFDAIGLALLIIAFILTTGK